MLEKEERERLATEEYHKVVRTCIDMEDARLDELKRKGLYVGGLDGVNEYFKDIKEWQDKELKRIRKKYDI